MADSKFPSHLKIAIIGGGPGGLASAIALAGVPDVQVKLYERSQELREVGAGISIGHNSWKVLQLLGVADSLGDGHPTLTVLSLNGRDGEEIRRVQKSAQSKQRTPIRTQRTQLQSALLQHIQSGTIQYGKKLEKLKQNGIGSIELWFTDGTWETADFVIGADGIRSVVRDAAWTDYSLKFTGTTIWRALLPRRELKSFDERFDTTAWWHLPNSHVFFSPVGQELSEIAAREFQDPAVFSASKSTWGVPVSNEYVESRFKDYLPKIQEAIAAVPQGLWREFAAFSGPELSKLTAWNNRIALVGDASHALSGAFGSGAGFAMEDGYIIAKCLAYYKNDLNKALPLFNEIRVPYYARMYKHLQDQEMQRAVGLGQLETPTEQDRVRNKINGAQAGDMRWIYENDIERVWQDHVQRLQRLKTADYSDKAGFTAEISEIEVA